MTRYSPKGQILLQLWLLLILHRMPWIVLEIFALKISDIDGQTEWCRKRKLLMCQHPSFIYHKWHNMVPYNMVPNPQSSSWLYWKQSLMSPWRSLHGWLDRVLGGAVWRSALRMIQKHQHNVALPMKNLALLMSAVPVPVLAHRIRVAAETNDRCPNARAFTSFIHKMGFYFYILCTADTKTNIF